MKPASILEMPRCGGPCGRVSLEAKLTLDDDETPIEWVRIVVTRGGPHGCTAVYAICPDCAAEMSDRFVVRAP